MSVLERLRREVVLVLVRVMVGGEVEAMEAIGVAVPDCGTEGMGVLSEEE